MYIFLTKNKKDSSNTSAANTLGAFPHRNPWRIRVFPYAKIKLCGPWNPANRTRDHLAQVRPTFSITSHFAHGSERKRKTGAMNLFGCPLKMRIAPAETLKFRNK